MDPITRREMYLQAIVDRDTDGTPVPVTREEWFLNEILQNGGTGGGVAYTVLGAYDTLAELETAHATGTAGDAYLVGDPTHVYVWIDGEGWHDGGAFTAIQGQKR